MALFVQLGALCWVQRVVGFSFLIPVFALFVGSWQIQVLVEGVGVWGPSVLLVGLVFVLVLELRILSFWVLLLTLFEEIVVSGVIILGELF